MLIFLQRNGAYAEMPVLNRKHVSGFGIAAPKIGHISHSESIHFSAQNLLSPGKISIPDKHELGTVIA